MFLWGTLAVASYCIAAGSSTVTLISVPTSPGKTHIGDCSVKGQGFEFLGYRFEAGRPPVLEAPRKRHGLTMVSAVSRCALNSCKVR